MLLFLLVNFVLQPFQSVEIVVRQIENDNTNNDTGDSSDDVVTTEKNIINQIKDDPDSSPDKDNTNCYRDIFSEVSPPWMLHSTSIKYILQKIKKHPVGAFWFLDYLFAWNIGLKIDHATIYFAIAGYPDFLR
mgnify:CR=1 FL=1